MQLAQDDAYMEEIIETHKQLIYGIALTHTRNPFDAEAKGTEYLASPDGRGPSFRIRYTTVPAYAVQSLRSEDYIVVYVSAERSFYLCWRMDAELETTLQEAYELLGMDRLTQPAAPGSAGVSSAPPSSVTAST